MKIALIVVYLAVCFSFTAWTEILQGHRFADRVPEIIGGTLSLTFIPLVLLGLAMVASALRQKRIIPTVSYAAIFLSLIPLTTLFGIALYASKSERTRETASIETTQTHVFSPDWSDFSVVFPISPTVTPVEVPPFAGQKAEVTIPSAKCVLRAYALKAPGNNMGAVDESLLFTFMKHEAETYGLRVDDMGIKRKNGRMYGYAHTHKIMDRDGENVRVNWYIETHIGPKSIFTTQTATLPNDTVGELPFAFYNSISGPK